MKAVLNQKTDQQYHDSISTRIYTSRDINSTGRTCIVVYTVLCHVIPSTSKHSMRSLIAALLLLSLFSCPWLPWVAHGGFPLGLFRLCRCLCLFPGRGRSWWLPAWSVSALPLLLFPGDLGCLPSAFRSCASVGVGFAVYDTRCAAVEGEGQS